MNKLIIALTLSLVAGTALANGGLSIDTAPQSAENIQRVEIDVRQLGHGSIDKFEAYNEKLEMAQQESKQVAKGA